MQPQASAKTKSWRIRWSLRAILTALTLVAIVLGVTLNRARRQRSVVAELRKLGAVVNYDCTRSVPRPQGFSEFREVSNLPQFMIDVMGVDYFHHVDSVVVPADRKRESLPLLKTLYGLRYVHIPWNSTGDDAIVDEYKVQLEDVLVEISIAVVG